MIVRVDWGASSGIGHVMRCLALIQAWRDRSGKVCVVTKSTCPSIQNRLEENGATLCRLGSSLSQAEDAKATSVIADQNHADWILIDGYEFSESYVLILKAKKHRIAVIDDDCAPAAIHADLIINHNSYADEDGYRKTGFSNPVLAGQRYTLLRREFLATTAHPRRPIEGVAQHLLITMGGADPLNATRSVLHLIETLDFRLRITVVIGAANDRAEAMIREFQTASSRHEVEFLLDPPDLVEVFCRADLAIAAAGVTASELGALGIPMALLITADNQVPVAAFFDAHKAALLLGDARSILGNKAGAKLSALIGDPDLRRQLSLQCSGLVDCHGADRVVEHLLNFPIALRPGMPSDAELVFRWANDSQTRAVSFSQEPIPWETHVAWYSQIIGSPECRFLIATNRDGFPVGLLRLDRKDTVATLSFSITAEHRGHGYGHKMVRLASTLAVKEGWCDIIHAWVKPHNETSLKVLKRSGFTESRAAVPKEEDACLLIFSHKGNPALC